MEVFHTCKHCGFEIEVDYDVGEHFAEIGEEKCPSCGEPIELDYDDLEEQAISSLADKAELYSGDR